MSQWLKLSQHSHSGRLRPHKHTSYVPLILLLIVVGVSLTTYTAIAASPPPESSSIGLSGTVPGKPPTQVPIIKVPNNGQRFTASPVTFSGTCPASTLIEIYKNDIFAGSTICDDKGTFSVEIDLMIGQNIIFARVYDSLNQAGSESKPMTVFYDALPAQAAGISPLDFGGAQLLINTDSVFRGVFPNKDLITPIDIIGGNPSYAFNVQWGDSTNKIVSRNDNASFKMTHVYNKPGIYQIKMQATDSKDRVAFLSVAAIVNGVPDSLAAASKNSGKTNKLLVLWPLYSSAFAIVISFWIGEKREKNLLMKHAGIVYN